MRQADKKYFGDIQQGRLNSDDSAFVVGSNEWINAENIRTGSTDKGVTGVVESVGGNTELPSPPSAKAFFLTADVIVNNIYALKTQPSINPSQALVEIDNTTNAYFITEPDQPNTTYIEEGEWNLYVPLSNYKSTTTPTVWVEVRVFHTNGQSSLLSTTQEMAIRNDSSVKTYNFKAPIPNLFISNQDRIGFVFYSKNLTGVNSKVIIYTQYEYSGIWYNFAITNLPNHYYDYITIGSVEDTENNRILYFNYDKSFLRQDRITCLDLDKNKQYNVLLSCQVDGNKYLRTEYIYRDTIPALIKLKDSSLYKIILNSANKTITIQQAFVDGDLVDSNLNIGDEFRITNSILNNIIFIVTDIKLDPISTVITVSQQIVDEIIPISKILYLNQLQLQLQSIPIALQFFSYINIGSKLEISSVYFPNPVYVTGINTYDNIIYINEYNQYTLTPAIISDISIYNPYILYEKGLNFDKNNIIHSAKISNTNTLSWVEGSINEPRKINIESGILANDSFFKTKEKSYEFPINFSEITLIKPPPSIPPIVKKIFSPNTINLIRYESFEFSFQFIYNDNEITVPGTYSNSTKLNTTLETEQFNAISINMSFSQIIPSTVKTINLICRYSDGKPIGGNSSSVIHKWEKSNSSQYKEIQDHNYNISQLNYTFYNDISGDFLSPDDTLRAFDNVPIFSKTQEVSKNRIFLANNTEGYDTPTETSLYGNISSQFRTESSQIELFAFAGKVGYYRDRGNNWSCCAWYVYVNGISGQRNGYYVITNPDTHNYQSDNADANSPAAAIPLSINFSNIQYIGTTSNSIADYIQNKYGRQGAYDPSGGIRENTQTSSATLTGFTNNEYSTISNDSKYRLGIVFYDYAMRKSGVCINNNNPQNYINYNSAGGVIIRRNLTKANVISLTFPIISNIPVPDLISNDIITISGTSNYDGTYTLLSIISKALDFNAGYCFYKISINKDIPTPPIGGQVCLFRGFRNVGLQINTPIRDYSYLSGYGSIEWKLNNVNNLKQIPEWACYYSIVQTLNLKTRFFLESNSNKATYVLKKSDNTYDYGPNVNYISTAVAIGIDTSALSYAGLGYSYSEGDMCTVILKSGNYFSIPIIKQDGSFIHLQNQNIGSLNEPINFQIYTPYKLSGNEPYYEIGQTFAINNPGTPIRSFSQTNGIIYPDSYIIQRNAPSGITYYGNAMSPNDTFWKRWDSDAGKVNIITMFGQTNKNTNISWSDTYISGSQINGSSTFRFGNETFVSDDSGKINKLQLTSKVQDQGQGIVMLALCDSEINSMYLGETQITDSTGKTQFFSANTGVVSTINTLKGNYGCISPESVVQYRGKVYFVDLANGRVVQYSDNGLDAISNIKMSRFWKNWSYKYKSMSKSDIELFGDRPFIFSMVDSGHDELLISLPKLSNDPPKGYLPDYPNVAYPFDILDYKGKTLVYCLGSAAQVYPHWQGSYSFTTENFVALQNRLFSFKNGKIYEHNQDLQNTFYGTYTPSSIMFTSNIFAQVPKVYDNFVAESNLVPNFVYFYNDYPYLQTSDLDDTSFVNLEGIWYANILRNKIVPTATGFTTDGLLTAEVMRNRNMFVQATFSPTTSPLELRLLQLGTSISKGHIIT